MNVLYGLYAPDDGEILVDDVVTSFHGPGDAMAAGIGMVHQHFMLIRSSPSPKTSCSATRTPAVRAALAGSTGGQPAARLPMSRNGSVSPSRRMLLSLTCRSACSSGPRSSRHLLVTPRCWFSTNRPQCLRRPKSMTSSQVMRKLRDAGTSIVFISHKLKEVKAIGDTITVIRRGRVVGQPPVSSSEQELASLMVGRPVLLTVEKTPAQPGAVVLDVEGLRVVDASGVVQVDEVSFSVREGEIYAIAGVQGNGQTEVTECPRRARDSYGLPRQCARQRHHDVVGARPTRPRDRLRAPRIARTTDWSVASRWRRTLILDMHESPAFAGRFGPEHGRD